VYIFFDALDECPDRHQFLKLIKEIHGWNFDTLHLLATSRYEPDIEKTLRDLVSHQVSMDEGLVYSDIQVYVSRALKDDNSKLSKYSAEKKENIKTTLSDGAHGVFRWVVCQLDALRKCRSPHELKEALTNLPKTLYETYDRILLDIDEGNRDDARKLLQWLAFSLRKVSLREAVEVLATDPDGKKGRQFDPDRRFDDPRDILTLCSNLVTVTDIDKTFSYPEYLKGDQGKFTELTLAHFSVREYLVSESLRTHRKLSFYHCDTKLANTFIAKTCLTYLLQFNKYSIGRDRVSYPLCSYAAEYWIRHTQPDNDDDPTLHQLIMCLLHPESTAYSIWLGLCYPHRYWRKCAPLYYMSEAGLAMVSRDLLEKGAAVNAQGGLYGNALQAASSRGRHAIVQLLLEKGADVNVQGGLYGNALQAASSEGHHPIVKLLLERGADVNAQGGTNGNALHGALLRGHHPTAELLLEKGANVNAQGGHYGNAL
ncbi:ankyrin repeat-containing domain protein, partial [Gautieria morchelliformis]